MACDHRTTINTKKSNKNVLVHCDGEILFVGHAGGITSTRHEVEELSTPQALVDRGRTLGLTYTPEQMIEALEKGATFNTPEMAALDSDVWGLDVAYTKRMEALGYTQET